MLKPSTAPVLTAFSALAPVFLLIALGWALRRSGFPGDGAFWLGAERLVYWVLFPALLFRTTAAAGLAELPAGATALALLLATSAVAALALALKPWLRLDDPGFTSVFQAAIRCNVYVGLAAAAALHGDAGVAAAGLVIAVLAPLMNAYPVLVLARYGPGRASARGMILAVLKNPLILACVAGFSLGALGVGPPGVVGATLDVLGRASLTLGLLCVGAGLEFARLRAQPGAVAVGAALKLVAHPAATALACWALGVGGLAAGTAVLFTALPISASSYVLARQLGGDAPLLAAMIAATTVAAAATLPLWLALSPP